MFRVKRKSTNEIYQVLDTHVEETYGITYFLIWTGGRWLWEFASNFVPPNWEEKEESKK